VSVASEAVITHTALRPPFFLARREMPTARRKAPPFSLVGLARYAACFISTTSFDSTPLASPNSIIVLGS